ncbi:YeeE/YedE family protein [Nodosilinea sp. P-1105]|uniref:YeeE/YedE family protein n=1 Tax=Nodosilinea sp. P-1105 TaxID=2546229 RepID=UPI00146E7DB4|nr:YeeE/YedE family protein [Nodosilinea sp. P-1105]NMF84549.1 YeeE/YedE family protein [Nodosilinea sp. P-1105]
MQVEWWYGLLGGGLIGLSATLLLACNGRIAGISGMVNGAITFTAAEIWRWLFLIGLLGGGLLYEYGLAPQPTPTYGFTPLTMIVAGFLVGFGTRMGNGCTSGHGVCGLGRLSGRSLAAVISFMVAGFVTVFITRHLLA